MVGMIARIDKQGTRGMNGGLPILDVKIFSEKPFSEPRPPDSIPLAFLALDIQDLKDLSFCSCFVEKIGVSWTAAL